MSATAPFETVPDLAPWDLQPRPRPLAAHVSFSVCADTEIRLDEFENDARNRTGANLHFGDDYASVSLSIGMGWPTEEEVIEVVGRLINVLDQARENARQRIADRAAVPA